MLTSCGGIATPFFVSTSPHPASTAQKTAGTLQNPTNLLNLAPNKANIHAQIGGLLIQSSDGFQCPYSSSNKNDLELSQLVFASDRTTYSQSEIAQMSNYLTALENQNGNEGVFNGGTKPPPTLRWISGGETSSVPGTAPGVVGLGGNCTASLTLTNTGNTPIQLSKVGVQLKSRPQQNTYQYRLIDACSLAVPYCPPTGESGGGDCSVYFANIQLGLGETNEVFSTTPSGLIGCTLPTIAPGVQINLMLTTSLATNIAQNLIYSIVPVFTIDTTQGTQTILVPQFESTLAFASASQFSCYGLQGTTFVQVKSPVFAEGSGQGKTQSWCV
jgi:hypothetical protein